MEVERIPVNLALFIFLARNNREIAVEGCLASALRHD
jgi:hypothetical protein